MSGIAKQRWAVIITGSVILIMMTMGCGGSSGSGGGGITYDGNRDAAEITSDNAQVLAASAYDCSSLEGPFGGISSLTDSTSTTAAPSGRPAILAISLALETALLKADPGAVAGASAVRAAIEVSDTVEGSCGGDASFTIDADDISGLFTGSFDFDSYCEDDTTLDGRASFRGRIDPDTEELQAFTFSFSRLSGTGDGERFRLNGSLSLSVDSEFDRIVTSMDLLFANTVTEEVLWLKDFRISVTERTGYDEIDISGRIYHPAHGYVDILTIPVFRVNDGDDYPSQGEFFLTGANGAEIHLRVLSNLQYQVEADLDGDDAYDWGPETYNW